MKEIKYIQAADLRLGAPFPNIVHSPDSAWLDCLIEAGNKPLEALLELCKEEKPDFLVLAGNLYFGDQLNIKAQIRLNEACKTLDEMDIPVFIIHGELDPPGSGFKSLLWPQNTFIFGTSPASFPIMKNGETCAIIHGLSMAPEKHYEIADLFQRQGKDGCFEIGILQCNSDAAVLPATELPARIKNLINSNLDAWALASCPEAKIISEKPFIAYSGFPQPHFPGYPNAGGCLVVSAQRTDSSWNCVWRAVNLAAICLETIYLDWKAEDTEEDFERALMKELNNNAEKLEADKKLIINLEIANQMPSRCAWHNGELTRAVAEKWLAETGLSNRIFINDIEYRAFSAEGINAGRDDLLGEISRLCNALLADDQKLELFARENLYLSPHANNHATYPRQKKYEDLRAILKNAEALCATALEKE